MEQGIELAQAIKELRAQLAKAMEEGEGHDLRFGIEDLELELQVMATKDAEVGGRAEAGVKFWLVGGGKVSGQGNLAEGSQRIQKLKLKLKPKLASTGEVPDLASVED